MARLKRTCFALTCFALALGQAAVARAESNCNDSIDNDGDGFVDDLDTTCFEQDCTDGLDNDGDGHTDALAAGGGNEGPDPDCQCLNVAAGWALEDTSGCTANDVGFVLIGLGTQTDGCVNASDTVTIQLGAQLDVTAANKWDIGMWVGLDPDVAKTARNGNSCRREILVPDTLSGTENPCSATWAGPYVDADYSGPPVETPDECGDLGNDFDCDPGPADVNAIYQFSTSVEIPCGRAADGFVIIPTCATWDQQKNDSNCFNFTQAVAGTQSKCNCDSTTATDVPRPALTMSQIASDCACTVSNDTATCSVTYRNPGQGTCNQASSASESRFSCGTASYMQFRTTASGGTGSFTGSSLSPNTRGQVTQKDANTLWWNPQNDGGSSWGMIGVNEVQTLDFTYVAEAAGDYTFKTEAYWANDWATLDPAGGGIVQTTLTCTMTETLTPVTLASFSARRRGGRIAFQWTTATETGNVGFHVYAEKKSGGIERLDPDLIPSRAVDSVEPQSYSHEADAAGLEGARFYVEDVSLSGAARRHGPFDLDESQGAGASTERIDWRGIRAAHEGAERARAPAEAAEWGRRASGLLGDAPSARGPLVDLLVDGEGLHRVTQKQLAAAGLDLSGLRVDALALWNRGRAVPLRATGMKRDPERFGKGSFVEFYGTPLDTLYTGTNVYTLGIDRAGAARAGTDPTAPDRSLPTPPHYLDTVRVEREKAYSFGSPNGDPWYDTLLFSKAGEKNEASLDVTVDGYVDGGAPPTVAIGLWGMTNWPRSPDHHVLLRWNGAQFADESFDGNSDHPISRVLAEGSLREGVNTLTAFQPGDAGVPYDLVALDGFSITYPRAFVARDGRLTFSSTNGRRFVAEGFTNRNVVAYRSTPAGDLVLLTGIRIKRSGTGFSIEVPGTGGQATYHLSTTRALRTPGISPARDGSGIAGGSAEYLVISHPDFLAGLDPLVQARRSQGYDVRVVDVRDVYAAFASGVLDAQAIRDYVAHAARSMGTRFVLLVGGDSYDYRNFLGTGSLSFLPSLYARTGPYVSFAPVDPLYADADGDGAPDVAIGRLPVRTAGELDSLVARTFAFEAKGYGRKAVLAADGYDGGSGTSFSLASNALGETLPDGWEIVRAHIDASGLAGARNILLGAMNGGVALTNFVGHSGPTVWTFQGLFKNADAEALANSGAPTVVAQWGCWNTYYVAATYETLAHKLLLSGDRGAAAVLGAATLTSVRSDRALGELVTPLLARPGKTIGEAVVEAKRRLARTSPEMIDVLLGWTLLGDPALVIER